MSRQAHLPPRCPFQKKPSNLQPSYNPTLNNGMPLHRRHKSVSHSYFKEEQPAWLDDLLENPESNSSGVMHRRSASDSLTLLDDDHLVSLTKLDHLRINTSASSETFGTSLKPGPIYGPNSPRGKGSVTFQEHSIVSALSEYVGQNKYLDESFSTSRVSAFGVAAEDTCGSTMEETQSMKRHPGQRSRIRKLQYIAELERTVDMLQENESDMAARVASLLQQRLSLSVENSKLKQQLVRLQQRKLLVDGQNQILKKEYEMLKVGTGYGSKKGGGIIGRSSSLGKSSNVLASDEISWQMLDMGKLNLKY